MLSSQQIIVLVLFFPPVNSVQVELALVIWPDTHKATIDIPNYLITIASTSAFHSPHKLI